jgi:hypothetical protein
MARERDLFEKLLPAMEDGARHLINCSVHTDGANVRENEVVTSVSVLGLHVGRSSNVFLKVTCTLIIRASVLGLHVGRSSNVFLKVTCTLIIRASVLGFRVERSSNVFLKVTCTFNH